MTARFEWPSSAKERRILCEGYHDRAFLRGWLLRLGALDPSQKGKIRLSDPSGKLVGSGTFAFDAGGACLKVVLAGSAEGALKAVDIFLKIAAKREKMPAEAQAKFKSFFWSTPESHDDALPEKQTLERLVIAAQRTVDRIKADEIGRWLRSAQNLPPATGPKSFAWAHMARSPGDIDSYEAFLESIWTHDKTANALETALRATGAWSVMESLVR